MKKFILAAVVLALAAADSQACVARGRAVSRSKAVSRTVARVAPVRTVLAVPMRAVGVFAAPCPAGGCPAPAAAAVVVPTAPPVKK